MSSTFLLITKLHVIATEPCINFSEVESDENTVAFVPFAFFVDIRFFIHNFALLGRGPDSSSSDCAATVSTVFEVLQNLRFHRDALPC
jgi:hypothetical protein